MSGSSVLYIDECLEGVHRLMDSDFIGPVNTCPPQAGLPVRRRVGSEEMVTINGLAEMVMSIAGKKLKIKHIPGPLGVRGRNSDNNLIKEKLGWSPGYTLKKGLEKTYPWVKEQVDESHNH